MTNWIARARRAIFPEELAEADIRIPFSRDRVLRLAYIQTSDARPRIVVGRGLVALVLPSIELVAFVYQLCLSAYHPDACGDCPLGHADI